MSHKYILNILFILICLSILAPTLYAENIDPANDGLQYAWGENVGWINLESGGDGGQGVDVSATLLTGYAWGENIGWINFNPATGGVVNDGNGNLSGYAWSENVGWINFNPAVGAVAAGNNPVDWPYTPANNSSPNLLYIDYTNPADADGTIETFQMYVTAGSGNIQIFTGTWDGINTIVPRAVATVAIQGINQINTWTGLNLAVQTGDVLGFYGSNLQVNRDLNTGTGNYAYTDVNPGIPTVGTPINTISTNTRKMAVYATGGGGVTINACGEFGGKAWGENIGWINFSHSQGSAKTSWVSPTDNVSPSTTTDFPLNTWFSTRTDYGLIATDCGHGVQEIRYAINGNPELIVPGAATTVNILTEGIHFLSYYAVDVAANIEPANNITIQIDKTAPGVSITTPVDGASYYLNTTVPADYLATDYLSGIDFVDAPVSNGSPIDTSTLGPKSFSVDATDNAGNVNGITNNYTVIADTIPPDITITTPVDGATYYVNDAVIADFSAVDNQTGIATLTSTVPDGSAVNTTAPGSYLFTVDATDNTGNNTVVALNYSVIYPQANIDPDADGSQYAWGENVGWINFKPSTGPGVSVTDTAVYGMAWGENVGWINFSPVNGGVINDGSGDLSGYAWGENVGWINFSGVSIDAGGIFKGMAWGENIGWINFEPISGGGVKTAWMKDTDGDRIPDGYGSNKCTGGNTVNCDDNCPLTPNADQADNDNDGTGDVCDDDDDNDGLSDSYETSIGTDPLNPDSDNDGSFDGEEIMHATDPLCDVSYMNVYRVRDDLSDTFIDISITGTDSGIHNDDSGAALPIGFDFTFYGQSYNTVHVSSNGYLTFDSSNINDFSNDPVPDSTLPNNIMALFWDDLNLLNSGSIFFETIGTAPNREFVTMYHQVPFYSDSSASLTFESILSESDGSITFIYDSLQNGSGLYADGRSASVGIENSDASKGIQYSYNGQGALYDGLTVKFHLDSGMGNCYDADSDGIYDDGDGSGTAGDNPCTGGNTASCDDNCVDMPNLDQADQDSDGIGNVCDRHRISGAAYVYPEPGFRASLSLDIYTSSLGTGWLNFYYSKSRLNFVATSITKLTDTGNTVIIEGVGSVNGTGGYTFTIIISDNPDSLAILIFSPDGTLYFLYGPEAISGGDFIIEHLDAAQYLLTTAVSPSGSGSVNPDCSGDCSYDSGTLATITSNANSGFAFSNWTGCDSSSGNICTMTMDADKSITANFSSCLSPIRIDRLSPVYYPTINEAVNAAQPGETVQVQEGTFTENIGMNNDVSMTLQGGYGCNFMFINGITILNGNININTGTVTIKDFELSN